MAAHDIQGRLVLEAAATNKGTVLVSGSSESWELPPTEAWALADALAEAAWKVEPREEGDGGSGSDHS